MSNQKQHTVSVLLNVYDLHPCNGCCWYFGFGLYHCGVQLKYDDNLNRLSKEYSYLGNALTESTGVFHCQPKHTFGAKFRTTLPMGTIEISARELSIILDKLRSQYLAKDYDILTKNCNHFCDDFVYSLTSQHISSWLNRTASIASCCGCCIPQSFYDALVEIQTNYNQNNDLTPSTSSNKYVSWIYSNSYMGDIDGKSKYKNKKIKNGSHNSHKQCIDSDSENENENENKNKNVCKNNKEEIDDYMEYKHSVSVIGLKCNDNEVNMNPITNTNLGINPLNEHLVLTNGKYDENMSNNKLKIKKYKNGNGFKRRLSPNKLPFNNVSLDKNNGNNSENINTISMNENDIDASSGNWTHSDSYQRLPKTPKKKKKNKYRKRTRVTTRHNTGARVRAG
eukprot:354006_1